MGGDICFSSLATYPWPLRAATNGQNLWNALWVSKWEMKKDNIMFSGLLKCKQLSSQNYMPN